MTYATGTWGEDAKLRSKERNEYFRLYRARRNVMKLRARAIVNSMLVRGRLKRGPCEVCGINEGRIEAHHPDYTKPKEIVWLCPKHHRDADRKLGLR